MSSYPAVREALDEFNSQAPEGGLILDAGCGAGRDANYLASLGRRVVALDLSLGLLQRLTVDVSCETRVARVRSDLSRPPLALSSCGGVWACGSLLHQPPESLGDAISALTATLMPGGVFAASLRSWPSTGWEVWGELSAPRWMTAKAPSDVADHFAQAHLVEVTIRLPDSAGWYMVRGRRP